jgi:hypothetical protein
VDANLVVTYSRMARDIWDRKELLPLTNLLDIPELELGGCTSSRWGSKK